MKRCRTTSKRIFQVNSILTIFLLNNLEIEKIDLEKDKKFYSADEQNEIRDIKHQHISKKTLAFFYHRTGQIEIQLKN